MRSINFTFVIGNIWNFTSHPFYILTTHYFYFIYLSFNNIKLLDRLEVSSHIPNIFLYWMRHDEKFVADEGTCANFNGYVEFENYRRMFIWKDTFSVSRATYETNRMNSILKLRRVNKYRSRVPHISAKKREASIKSLIVTWNKSYTQFVVLRLRTCW